MLGLDTIDEIGPNAGLYERATAAAICDYFDTVLEEHLVPSGQVRFFGMSDYVGDGAHDHRFVSRVTGETTTVRVRRRLVDATYLETPVPSTHVPPFAIDADAQLIPVNGLVDLTDAGTGFTVIGAGKTAMDACGWLLDHGVEPDAIRWIRPRDAWLLDRAYQQPLELVGALIEGVSLTLEAATLAESVPDLFARLEACGQLVRIDPAIEPTMYRCATVSQGELASLRSIENVVRKGRVQSIGASEIVLEEGSVTTDTRQIHVDCSAAGLRVSPACPIFGPERITLQQVRTCQPTFNAALVGYVEAARTDDGDKNRICPPNPYPDAAPDWISGTRISQGAQNTWLGEPDVAAWMQNSRLDAARGLGDHLTEPRVQSAIGRYGTYAATAITNLELLQSRAGAG